MFKTSTGEFTWCEGKNNLKPLDVIYHPITSPEIADVNLDLFPSFFSHEVKLAIFEGAIDSVEELKKITIIKSRK